MRTRYGPLKKRYGRLATDPTVIKDGKIKCLCDCGNTTYVRPDKLKRDEISSCGCWREDFMIGKTWPDIPTEIATVVEPGARFGWLVALTEPYSVPGGKNRMADCICEAPTEDPETGETRPCGNTKTAVAGHLLKGNTKSCNCWRVTGSSGRHRTPQGATR